MFSLIILCRSILIIPGTDYTRNWLSFTQYGFCRASILDLAAYTPEGERGCRISRYTVALSFPQTSRSLFCDSSEDLTRA